MFMRITELKGRPVVDSATARRIGLVVDLFVDAGVARLVALAVGAPGADKRKHIAAESIGRIGRDAIMVNLDPATQRTAHAANLQDCLDYRCLTGLEVLDEQGDRIGYLHDARLERDQLTIVTFELNGSLWRRCLDLREEIPPYDVAASSRDAMVLRSKRAWPAGRRVVTAEEWSNQRAGRSTRVPPQRKSVPISR